MFGPSRSLSHSTWRPTSLGSKSAILLVPIVGISFWFSINSSNLLSARRAPKLASSHPFQISVGGRTPSQSTRGKTHPARATFQEHHIEGGVFISHSFHWLECFVLKGFANPTHKSDCLELGKERRPFCILNGNGKAVRLTLYFYDVIEIAVPVERESRFVIVADDCFQVVAHSNSLRGRCSASIYPSGHKRSSSTRALHAIHERVHQY